MTILFLYIVGYMIGIGVEVQTGGFNQHPRWVIFVSTIFIWPIMIGKAIAK